MRIAGVASAFPRQYFSQQEITSALKQHWADKLGNPDVLDRLLSRVGVESRHLALPIEAYDGLTSWGKANDAWIEVSEELAEQALCKALTRAGLSVKDLGAIFFVSVTGIASPSIDARLINRMGLPNSIKRIPIFGLGCVAGAAGIARAADYVRAYPAQCAALVSVELCSLTWQREDLSAANLISSGLFGDGAAAVVEDFMNGRRPAADSYGLLAAMGPGFCSELVPVAVVKRWVNLFAWPPRACNLNSARSSPTMTR
jgi:alkylresorcinol/alkylpyrone synthase